MRNALKISACALFALFASNNTILPSPIQASTEPQTYVLDVAVTGANAYQISMWIPAGSTSDSIPGIAHVLEHLKFKMNEGKGFVAFDAIPGSSSNASTTYESTRYDLNVPAEGLLKALETMAAMTKPLTITEADLKLEKSIVQQELLQRTQSDPDTLFYQDYYSALYTGLPYEHPPGGTQESVSQVTMKDVMAFDAAHYQGSKSFVLISGPPLAAGVRAEINKLFPQSGFGDVAVGRKFDIKRDDAIFKSTGPFLQIKKAIAFTPSEITRQKSSSRARAIKLTISKIISAPTPWRSLAAASLLSDAIRSRLPEGLQEKIAEDNGLVQDWSVGVNRMMDGVWQINFSASLENGIAPADVRAAFESYMTTFAKDGLSSESFDRLKARNFLVNEWENAASRANSLGEDSVVFGYEKAISYTQELENTKIEDVNALLKALQRPGRVGIAVIIPQGSTQ
jgi:predicted Zn-dependent peptidase